MLNDASELIETTAKVHVSKSKEKRCLIASDE